MFFTQTPSVVSVTNKRYGRDDGKLKAILNNVKKNGKSVEWHISVQNMRGKGGWRVF